MSEFLGRSDCKEETAVPLERAELGLVILQPLTFKSRSNSAGISPNLRALTFKTSPKKSSNITSQELRLREEEQFRCFAVTRESLL